MQDIRSQVVVLFVTHMDKLIRWVFATSGLGPLLTNSLKSENVNRVKRKCMIAEDVIVWVRRGRGGRSTNLQTAHISACPTTAKRKREKRDRE